MDDGKLGLVIRQLRRKRGWRQTDLAAVAGVSQSTLARCELGHFDALSLRVVRAIFAALDARIDLVPRWRGGELDRLIDSRHAAIVASAADVLVADGWAVVQEVTYAIYGERGSIDLLGLRADTATAAIMEVKSEITSWEETQRRFDEKVRLLPKIVFDREGWRPRVVGKILVIDSSMTNRRRIDRLGSAIDNAYPARSREVRRWIRLPDRPISGIWFLSPTHPRGSSGQRGGPRRVRMPISPNPPASD
ncbi:MAG: helix-turn-helix transcriptional regulator [Candidatus Limnocylindrales bacterium]